MTSKDNRHSQAAEASLITDDRLRAETEALNGLRQYDVGLEIINEWLDRGSFRLRASLILSLHREALSGLSQFAGNYRPAGVEIIGSNHEPIGAHLVPECIEEMCDYVNENWEASSAIHLGSYIMWRLNWIHPFSDGNGRTSRILSYVILCIKSGSVLPGTPTIPEQIVENRDPYFEALDAADLAFLKTKAVDVSKMEDLLSGMLAKQLTNLYEKAGGTA